jgi:maltose O-acetyltransferase
LRGKGTIDVGEAVEIGVINSPFFFNGYGYLEARNNNAKISLGNHVKINNNCCIVANESTIIIDNNVLIGFNCQIINSDFHNLDPKQRILGTFESKPVHIAENVFLGNNVTILKGVAIGRNSVIAAGSVVVNDIPENVIAGGNPAKVLRSLSEN